jgi:tripartite-type tricarboxylate transporter receptor subunit TctC
VSQGNSGIGTPSHVGGLLFQQAIGAKFTMIPYRGAGQSSADLVAGNIDVLLDTPALSLTQHRAGNVKAFAVADSHRLATAPDIPTTDEAGLPGFYFTFWHALWAPKGTPKDIVAKLNDAARKALQDATIRKRLEDLSNEVFPPDQLTPEALAKFHHAEIEKWWPIIKAADIKAQ